MFHCACILSLKTSNLHMNQNMFSFLDDLLIGRGTKIETTVYRKSRNNDICLNWSSFAPVTWKRGINAVQQILHSVFHRLSS